MCGRYGLITGEKDILKRFDVRKFDGNFSKNYNIAPNGYTQLENYLNGA